MSNQELIRDDIWAICKLLETILDHLQVCHRTAIQMAGILPVENLLTSLEDLLHAGERAHKHATELLEIKNEDK